MYVAILITGVVVMYQFDREKKQIISIPPLNLISYLFNPNQPAKSCRSIRLVIVVYVKGMMFTIIYSDGSAAV